jgi:hypothetical protein
MAQIGTASEGHSPGTQHNETLYCPFCEFSDSDAYFLTQHVELCHPEGGDSPFIVKDEDAAATREPSTDAETEQNLTSRDDTSDGYAECPHGCGEIVDSGELTNHLDFHIAEEMAMEDIGVTFKDDHPDPRNPDGLIEHRFATNISKALDHDIVLKSSSSINKGKKNNPGRTRRLGVRIFHPPQHIVFLELTRSLARGIRTPCTRKTNASLAPEAIRRWCEGDRIQPNWGRWEVSEGRVRFK